MQLDAIRTLVAADMRVVDEIIAKQFGSDISLIKELSKHIFDGGGKRLRPMLVLLSAKTFNYTGAHHIDLAVIIELIHTATLLHDDVVDHSTLRRGKPTANVIWGNEASVLVGDFLYSRTFQMMVGIENMTVMSILADASNTIAAGEVMQLVNCNDPTVTEAQYLETIRRKTATLFAAATEVGAIIAQQQTTFITAMANYGLNLGMAFQLVDDALDYSASAEAIGKNIGDDLREGKPTLPLIYLLQQGNPQQKQMIADAIKNKTGENHEKIFEFIRKSGALTYTYDYAKNYYLKALEAIKPLNDSSFKQALIGLANFAIDRAY